VVVGRGYNILLLLFFFFPHVSSRYSLRQLSGSAIHVNWLFAAYYNKIRIRYRNHRDVRIVPREEQRQKYYMKHPIVAVRRRSVMMNTLSLVAAAVH